MSWLANNNARYAPATDDVILYRVKRARPFRLKKKKKFLNNENNESTRVQRVGYIIIYYIDITVIRRNGFSRRTRCCDWDIVSVVFVSTCFKRYQHSIHSLFVAFMFIFPTSSAFVFKHIRWNYITILFIFYRSIIKNISNRNTLLSVFHSVIS
jgi:hypothetical protein